MALAIASAGAALHAQQATADLVLTNGKIITVDEKFTITQAVAVRGDRIIAVGTTQQINALAGPSTRRIDLKGKAILHGLIDSHAHLWRAAATWEEELRLDGVDTRRYIELNPVAAGIVQFLSSTAGLPIAGMPGANPIHC